MVNHYVITEMENYVRLKMLIYIICKKTDIEILSGAPSKYIKLK